MPGYDGTGPRGMGSRTGGGFGYCPPGTTPVTPNIRDVYGIGRGGIQRGGGRGHAFGGSRGRGFGGRRFDPGYGAPMSSTNEIDMLKENKEFLNSQVEGIEKKISEIEKAKK